MRESSVQRWLAIPLILLLVGAAVWVATMRESGSPPPGAATVAAPPMPQIAALYHQQQLQRITVPQPRRFIFRERLEQAAERYNSWITGGRVPPPSCFVSGIVRDRDGGHPIPDAFVVAWMVSDAEGLRLPRVTGDETPTAFPLDRLVDADVNGAYRLGPLPEGRYILEAYHEDGQLLPWTLPGEEWPITLTGLEERDGVDLYVYEGHTVTFKAVDAFSGNQIRNVRLRPIHSHITVELARVHPATIHTRPIETDASGEVAHDGLFGGATVLQLSAPGHYLANELGGKLGDRVTVELDEDSRNMTHTVELTPIPRIRARILMPDGRPAPGAKVTWRPGNPHNYMSGWHRALVEEMVPADESGLFTFLPPAAFNGFLAVRADGYPMTLSGPVLLTESIPTELTVQLEVPARVEARVTMPNGEPARRAMVTIKPAGSYSPAGIRYIHEFTADTDQWSLTALCDAEGIAVLEGLSTGQYMIEAESEGLAPSPTRFLRVQSGETESVVLRLGNAES